MNKIISTEKAPKAIGPYSQAIDTGDFLFLSGQIPIDPATGRIAEGGIREQSAAIFKNIGAILEAAGYGYADIVKTTCFLADMSDFSAFNETYQKYFTSCPARSCVAVRQLPRSVLAEVEVVAHKK